MRMVKSLLLGGAAGLTAVAGAQAADLPARGKAPAVEYVRVCSLYGAGFYYIPGTDICLKFGGFVRFQAYWGQGSSPTLGPYEAASGLMTREGGNDFVMRGRAVMTIDTRQQTAYGTLRTYMLVGFNQDTGPGGSGRALYANRGFIQFAGFTFGLAQSFYDAYPSAAYTFFANRFTSDTGDLGVMLAAYTAQFGNGFSATISLEDTTVRRTVLWNVGAAATGVVPVPGTAIGNSYGNVVAPDIIGNIRIDQPWGFLQGMAALHWVRPTYYTPGSVVSGHPSDAVGYALGVGGVIRLPMIAPGDSFAFQFNWTEGATRFAMLTSSPNNNLWTGSTVANYWLVDGVYGGTLAGGNTFGVSLTRAWSINAAFEHLWTPALRTSIYGTYAQIRFPNVPGGYVCAGGYVAGSVCNPDASIWLIGSRTQWEPVSGLIMGVDVMYERIRTASAGAVMSAASVAATRAPRVGPATLADEGVVSATFRIQRNWVP